MAVCSACEMGAGTLESCPPFPPAMAGASGAIPGVFTLHVGPEACGRRMCIPAYEQGTRTKRAHLYLDESDLISGSYEDLVPEAVEQVLTRVNPRPRAIMITVTCVDDILGTDREALMRALHMRFPQVRFAIHAMDPIRLDSGFAPRVSYALAQYSLLDQALECDRDRGLNIVGNVGRLAAGCELFEFAHAHGIHLRQVSDGTTLDDFLVQEKSSWNVVFHPVGLEAAKMLQRRFGTPFRYLPKTVDPAQVADAYAQLCALIGVDADALGEKLRAATKRAHEQLNHTVHMLDGRAIVVGGMEADWRPASLARDLLNCGFNVRLVVSGSSFDGDETDICWIAREHPEVEIVRTGDISLAQRTDYTCALCIGPSVAYALGARYVASWPEEILHWGFEGIEHMCASLEEAAACEAGYDFLMQNMPQAARAAQPEQVAQAARTPQPAQALRAANTSQMKVVR